jgi:hypothetical protein
MMKRRRFLVRALGFLVLLLGSGAPLWAQTELLHEDVLQLELWLPIAPIPNGGLTQPQVEKEAPQKLLKEARWLISGMVFGWKVVYVPSDTARQVAEILEVKPLGEIPWGDPGLQVTKTWSDFDNNRFYASFLYTLTSAEKDLRSRWAAVELQTAGGRGEWVGTDTVTGREKAFNQAIKASLRNALRPEVYNKPARIEADILLLHSPLFGSAGGHLFCTADFRYYLTLVRPYAAY